MSSEEQMFKIAVSYDSYPDETECFAIFDGVQGIDGEYIIDKNKEIYQIKLFNGELANKFLGQLKGGLKQLPENINLSVQNNKGDILGAYFLAGVEVISWTLNKRKSVDLVIHAINHSAYLGTMKSWEMRLSDLTKSEGAWLKLDPKERQGWLHVALQNNRNRKGDRKNIIVDGKLIDDRNSFYCALGEAVNGPGGYFGRCLDGVNDCLRGVHFGPAPQSLTWTSSNISKSNMHDFDEFISILTDVFESNDSKLIIE